MYRSTKKTATVVNFGLAIAVLALVGFWPGWRAELQAQDYYLNPESEWAIAGGQDCGSRDINDLEDEQCADAMQNQGDVCNSYCADGEVGVAISSQIQKSCAGYAGATLVSCTVEATCSCVPASDYTIR